MLDKFVIKDLKTYYKQAFSEIVTFENEVLIRAIKNNIKSGISNNEYRKKVSSKIMSRYFIATIKRFHNDNKITPYNFEASLRTQFIRGLLQL